MTRFWTSWWIPNSDNPDNAPFQWWWTGARWNAKDEQEDSICALIEAEDETQVWSIVGQYFQVLETRFCNVKGDDWNPGDRFPGFQNRSGRVPPSTSRANGSGATSQRLRGGVCSNPVTAASIRATARF
jgi:hypothetical protein